MSTEYGMYEKFFFLSSMGSEACSHCGGNHVSYSFDIQWAYEIWSPMYCESCKKHTYEVWRSGTLIRIVGILREIGTPRPKKKKKKKVVRHHRMETPGINY